MVLLIYFIFIHERFMFIEKDVPAFRNADTRDNNNKKIKTKNLILRYR